MQRYSIDDQRQLISNLIQLVSDRVRGEAASRASFETRQATLAEQFASERGRLTNRLKAERESAQAQYTNELSRIVREYESAIEKAMQENDRVFRETSAEYQRDIEQANADWEVARGRLNAEYDAAVRELQRGLAEFRDRADDHRKDLITIEERARRIIRKRYCWRKVRDVSVSGIRCESPKPLDVYVTSIADAQAALNRLSQQKLPKFLMTFVIFMIPVVVVTAGLLAAGLLMDSTGIAGANGEFSNQPDAKSYLFGAAIGACALGLMGIVYVILRPMVIANTRQVYTDIARHLATGDLALETATKLRAAEADMKKIARHREGIERLRQAEAEHQRRLEQIAKKRENRFNEATAALKRQRELVATDRDTRQKLTNDQYAQRSQQLKAIQELEQKQLEERERSEIQTAREMHQRSWSRVVAHWKQGLAATYQSADDMQAFCAARFPDWYSTDWSKWTPPEESLPILRFGSYAVDLKAIEHGLPEHEELRPERTEIDIPAMNSFSERPALLWEAWGDGRMVASSSMRNVMLRFVTSLPPGKVRFTIVDPVGLGQNFSAFMHLADFDEKLVNHRIWTDPTHIQQRLADLTEHMEDVIQTFLRNEFQTIDEYNRHAGEVAEPYHILVVANFPAGFNDESASRLQSIVASGARCGVYTLISTDSRLEWPRNFNLGDIEAHAATVEWNGNRFAWRDHELKDLRLTLDDPPDDERFTQIIREVGKKAKEAIRVEVPFSIVAAKPNEWWTHDSRGGIEVPLGKAGASKLQYLRLGKGTSQHVLISGKTGSGKSTLLHAMITNTAIHYGPDEVEFYLIDFKKGVEFKPYAASHLPHARVVAIESEREFGMSVLERLDQELRIRGDLFRQAGVQDIKNFRDENPGVRMPRVLLVIDEFQEFFTQDDKVAQDAALLLDRLVRQGRAFGIHVLLGSQTLAGAYSLARSTLGQMAVRIALQCSEADSHLILSEDNTAARLLNRPGEAIYNDANGLFEGNHPFQVVWLSSAEQENYLNRLAEKPNGQAESTPATIVFEGNAPADPSENKQLIASITESEPASVDLAPRAWLGSAVAIKDPTAAVFRRQSGANLLVVGQQEEMALGMLATAAISLAAGSRQTNGAGTRVIVLDGTRPEAPEAGWWKGLAGALGGVLEVESPSQSSKVIAELVSEVARRQESASESETPVFLMIYNLARCRDLRRSDDDLGFSSFDDDKPASPSKQLLGILRDGPAVGVHCILWCDTYNTVTRWFDRSTLRELDQRVLFQMSANDSSNLVDSPIASRLGQHRAILYSEELGHHERFRPYGVPTREWLDWVANEFASRAKDESLL